jgi:hypothetical protein
MRSLPCEAIWSGNLRSSVFGQKVSEHVNGGITIAAPVLRGALGEAIARECRLISARLRRDESDEGIKEARAATERFLALGDLMHRMGWEDGGEESFALHFGEHDWAAATALRVVIEREHQIAVRSRAVGDRQAAEAAAARRAEAVLALEMLVDASERDGRDIEHPPPPLPKDPYDPRLD